MIPEGLIERLAPVTLVVGKGGVGKTTIAAALAKRFAQQGARTLVLTTDPAATLLTALGRPIERTRTPQAAENRLDAWAFDTAGLRQDFLDRWRTQIATILDRGTYLDADDINGLVDAALPGADEIFAVLALGDVVADTGYQRIVIDTAPTGHTLRLLTLPRSFEALVRLLDAMQEKHRFMVRALTHRYRADAADALIEDLRRRVTTLQSLLADRARCSAVLVTRNEPVVLAESQRYLDALELTGIAVAGIVVVGGNGATSLRAAAPVFFQPLAATDSSLSPSPGALDATHPLTIDRSIVIVGGKGGVGKTTSACALAIHAADRGLRTLLVSTDPAPSIADALAMEVGHDETIIGANLSARQIDATAAFRSFRETYQARIDGLFAGLAGRGVDIAHDRQIIRDLLSLAPPGIDELYALTIIGDELAAGRFDQIIVDPAPTGHLLRLLDMPRLAIAWAHQIMRLMLKYQQVVGLGEAAQDLLDFAKRTRALDERLHDPARSGSLIVSLDEPLVREETGRLIAELSERKLPLVALMWNRGTSLTPALPTATPIPQLFAPANSPPPIGVPAIRDWYRSWGFLASTAAG